MSKMDLSEITQLIEIRNYIVLATNNFNLMRGVSRELAKMLTLVDKRITEKLLSDEFKAHIGFADADKAQAEAIEANNIRAGMKPSDAVIAIDAGKAVKIK